jgi:hypothetical protein
MVFSFEKKWLFNSYFKYNDNFVNKCIFLFIFYPMMLTVIFLFISGCENSVISKK